MKINLLNILTFSLFLVFSPTLLWGQYENNGSEYLALHQHLETLSQKEKQKLARFHFQQGKDKILQKDSFAVGDAHFGQVCLILPASRLAYKAKENKRDSYLKILFGDKYKEHIREKIPTYKTDQETTALYFKKGLEAASQADSLGIALGYYQKILWAAPMSNIGQQAAFKVDSIWKTEKSIFLAKLKGKWKCDNARSSWDSLGQPCSEETAYEFSDTTLIITKKDGTTASYPYKFSYNSIYSLCTYDGQKKPHLKFSIRVEDEYKEIWVLEMVQNLARQGCLDITIPVFRDNPKVVQCIKF